MTASQLFCVHVSACVCVRTIISRERQVTKFLSFTPPLQLKDFDKKNDSRVSPLLSTAVDLN